MIKSAFAIMAAMLVFGACYVPTAGAADSAEFQLRTAELVSPQVREHANAYLIAGDKTRAKAQWAWFRDAHVNLGESLASMPPQVYLAQFAGLD